MAGIALVLALVCLCLIFFPKASPVPVHPFFKGNKIQVIAHRGGMGLWPENTLYAFQRAVELGADLLEMDVQSTREGLLVVIHDGDVDRTTDGKGPVHTFSLRHLQSLDAGFSWTRDGGKTHPFRGRGIRVPTLEEILRALPESKMSIEMKQHRPSLARPLCEMLRRHHGTQRILVSSFYDDLLDEFRQACPGVATSAGKSGVQWFYALSRVSLTRLYRPVDQTLQVPEYFKGLQILTRGFVHSAHDQGMRVNVWVINKRKAMRRLLGMGVDGIITDYPDRLLDLLGRRSTGSMAGKETFQR